MFIFYTFLWYFFNYFLIFIVIFLNVNNLKCTSNIHNWINQFILALLPFSKSVKSLKTQKKLYIIFLITKLKLLWFKEKLETMWSV